MAHIDDAKLKPYLKKSIKAALSSLLKNKKLNGLDSQSSVYKINTRHDAAREVCITRV